MCLAESEAAAEVAGRQGVMGQTPVGALAQPNDNIALLNLTQCHVVPSAYALVVMTTETALSGTIACRCCQSLDMKTTVPDTLHESSQVQSKMASLLY